MPSIKIGQYVRFGRNAAVNAGGDVEIGDGVWLSPGSQLLRQDHDPYGRLSIGSRTVAMTPITDVLQAHLSVYQDLFHLRGEVEFDGASFMLMKKI